MQKRVANLRIGLRERINIKGKKESRAILTSDIIETSFALSTILNEVVGQRHEFVQAEGCIVSFHRLFEARLLI